MALFAINVVERLFVQKVCTKLITYSGLPFQYKMIILNRANLLNPNKKKTILRFFPSFRFKNSKACYVVNITFFTKFEDWHQIYLAYKLKNIRSWKWPRGLVQFWSFFQNALDGACLFQIEVEVVWFPMQITWKRESQEDILKRPSQKIKYQNVVNCFIL